jgi:hypothetical protein
VKTKHVRDGFMPWAAIALGTTGYFLAHQIGSDATFQDCRAGSPWIVILGTLVGLAVIAVGALGSWRVYASESESPARRLVAIVGLLTCVLFVIGVTLPFIAALVIPRCWA